MPGWRERLVERARESLNAAQDVIADFERDGGWAGVADRAAERARVEEERLAAGKHPLNPDYRRQVRTWYARLELPPGASIDEVRRAFRALMRRYHPDRFTGDAEQEDLATRLSQDLTVAYEGLLEHLGER